MSTRVLQLIGIATCAIAVVMGAVIGSEVALWTCRGSRDGFDCLGRSLLGAGVGLVLGAVVGIALAWAIVRVRRTDERGA